MAMENFIQRIVNQLIKSDVNWEQQLILFPNKRPVHFFKRELQKHLNKPIWKPSIHSIDDFVKLNTNAVFPDKMSTLHLLWTSFKRHLGNTKWAASFDSFYSFGEILFKDFDRCDKELADPSLLFSEITDLNQIDKAFPFNEEQLAAFRLFWSSVSSADAHIEKEFLNIWSKMGAIYFDFKSDLRAKGYSYSGMALRDLVETENGPLDEYKSHRISICGFNAGSKAEEELFRQLKLQGDCHFYFDADNYYLNKIPQHEAGQFLREQRDLKTWALEPGDYMLSEKKNLKIVAASGPNGMAQAAAREFSLLPDELKTDKCALILGDESILVPLLSALELHDKALNITMGYPLHQSPLASFSLNFLEMHAHPMSKSGSSYHHLHLLRLIQNPLFPNHRGGRQFVVESEKRNRVIIRTEDLRESLGEDIDFFLDKDPLSGLENLLTSTRAKLERDLNAQHSLEHLLRIVIRLEDLCLADPSLRDIRVLRMLFKNILRSEKVAFEGEPLEGVQVMGVLESRNLDFETVIISSVNEGVLPRGIRHDSLIPFAIRKAFELNTHQEEDAIYAYHFYRLLQRAKNVVLIFNDQTSGMQRSEPSRFIYQLEREFSELSASSSIRHEKFLPRNSMPEIKEAIVAKTEDVMNRLAQYEVGAENQKSISPSALKRYLISPMQFYYQNVAGFFEDHEISEGMDASLFGTLVHNSMESLYSAFKGGKRIEKSDFDRLLKEYPGVLESQLNNLMGFGIDQLSGRDLLQYEMADQLCKNILKADARLKDLYIHGLEYPNKDAGEVLHYDFEISGGKKVRLSGFIDRIDEVDGVKRIIDYKTGKVDLYSITKSLNLSGYFTNTDKSVGLQALFYTYVYLKNHPNERVQPVIYSLKKGENLIVPVWGEALDMEALGEFEELLRNVLDQVWDEKIPFEVGESVGDYPLIEPLI